MLNKPNPLVPPLLTRRFQRVTITLILFAIALASWDYMLQSYWLMSNMSMSHAWMPPLPHKPWTIIDFTLTFTMWAAMMVAMMTPSVYPMAIGFHKVRDAADNNQHPYLSLLGFLSGYYFIWMLFCGAATLLEWQFHRLALLTPMMEPNNIVFVAVWIALAGIYQLTPWKSFCLDHCRGTKSLEGECHSDAFIVGLHHGIQCLGTCWALMLLMFAVGVMNMEWMVALTVIVSLEKILPIKTIWLRVSSGLALLTWAGWVLLPMALLVMQRFEVFMPVATN